MARVLQALSAERNVWRYRREAVGSESFECIPARVDATKPPIKKTILDVALSRIVELPLGLNGRIRSITAGHVDEIADQMLRVGVQREAIVLLGRASDNGRVELHGGYHRLAAVKKLLLTDRGIKLLQPYMREDEFHLPMWVMDRSVSDVDARDEASKSNQVHITLKDDWTTIVTRIALCFEVDELNMPRFRENRYHQEFPQLDMSDRSFLRLKAMAVRLKKLQMVDLWVELADPSKKTVQVAVGAIMRAKGVKADTQRIGIACAVLGGVKFKAEYVLPLLEWIDSRDADKRMSTILIEWIQNDCAKPCPYSKDEPRDDADRQDQPLDHRCSRLFTSPHPLRSMSAPSRRRSDRRDTASAC